MRSWIKDIFDGARGKTNEVGEAIADDPRIAIPAMEQSIRDGMSELEKSKNALTDVMAEETMAAKEVVNLEAKLEEYEGYALEASEKSDEGLLNEVIDKIGEVESELTAKRAMHEGLRANVQSIKTTVTEIDRNIKSMRTRVKTIKANEYAQQAAMKASAKYSGASSSTRTAVERMKRIEDRQAKRAAKMAAARDLEKATSGEDLDAKLAAAGIGKPSSSRDDIMARIKAKKAKG